MLQGNFSYSNPWYDIDNQFIQLEIEQLRMCGVEIPAISAFPLSISLINDVIESTNQLNLSEDCQQILNDFKKELKKNLYNTKNVVGFQTKRPDIYFQDFGKRLTSDSHMYLSSSKSGQNYAFNLSLQVFSDDLRFDESYFSYYFNNHILSIGRTSKWWSPSFNSSLIISNSARPSPGISFSNYHPKTVNSKYLSFLGPVSYEFFLNRLENDRHVPNALLFGNRVSIQPNKRLKISLFRTAQLGGDGRKLNSQIFFDMLRGKDNYDSSLSNKENEPGNQLGGLDFNILFLKNKNLAFYGQIVGEDESGYLPSKTFYSLGASYSWDEIYSKKINFEYSDTGSRQINSTYNHSIYKDGYRYYGDPIGSAFGADSKISTLTYQQILENHMYIHFKAIKASLNYNNSSNFFIKGFSDDLNILQMSLRQRFLENIYLKVTLQYVDSTNADTYDNLSTNASVEYRW